MIMSGANTYTGLTTVNAGTLAFRPGIKTASPLTIASGAKLLVPPAGPSTYNPQSQYRSGSNATPAKSAH